VIFLCFALSGFSSRGIKNDQTKDKNAYYSEKLEKKSKFLIKSKLNLDHK